MDLGRVGLWHFLDAFPASIARAAAREIEHLGFKALWIPEALGREVFTHAGVLASLHPKSLDLARERAWGSHPYFVPPEHTARARRALGPGKLLAPEQMVCLERDASAGRAIARQAMQMYLGLPNYVRNLLSLGFTTDDVANGGSGRPPRPVGAGGGIEAVAARVKAHHDAGADHVCLQVLRANPNELPLEEWRELAAALLR